MIENGSDGLGGDGLPVCRVLQGGHDGYLAGDLSAEDMEALVAGYNEGLFRVADAMDWGDNSDYWLSGWWDEATRTCPEAFFDPQVAGRP